MRLAIHNGKDKPVSWNTRWIDYCEKNNIPYIGVDCYSYDIIETLRKEGVTHLMWAFSLALPKDHIMAKSVLNAANKMGIRTFPNFDSNWHFEDKIAQKYLLEAIGAPVVKSWTFYDKQKALDFAQNAYYPIVAKLRKGAGSKNVILIHNLKECRHYVRIMFGRGKNPYQSFNTLVNDRLKAITEKKKTYFSLIDIIGKLKVHMSRRKLFPKEIGYVYFQEFLPNNTNDLRISVVGDKIWGYYRGVRKDDFRASGSGIIDYDTLIPLDIVKRSYELSKRLSSQSIGFDYVKAPDGSYKIVEMSYGFVGELLFNCKGYWDGNYVFHEDHLLPEECILLDFIDN